MSEKLKDCLACGGSGSCWVHGHLDNCSMCNGTGLISAAKLIPDDFEKLIEEYLSKNLRLETEFWPDGNYITVNLKLKDKVISSVSI